MPEDRLLPFECTEETGVVTLTLEDPDKPVVVLNRALIERLDRTLDAVLEAGSPKGLVLASRGKVFVAGADLKEIVSLDHDGLDEYLQLGARVFGRLATLPCTTVAAINGAALGGGLEIAMHCDYLVAATAEKPYPVGLPEAGLSICPGWGGTNLLPARMSSSPESAERAIRMTATGQPFKSPQDASEAGVIDRLCSGDELLDVARRLAVEPKTSPRAQPRSISDADSKSAVHEGLSLFEAESDHSEAARAVIDCVRVGLDRGWEAALEKERSELNRLRGTDAGKAAIEAFFAKSSKK